MATVRNGKYKSDCSEKDAPRLRGLSVRCLGFDITVITRPQEMHSDAHQDYFDDIIYHCSSISLEEQTASIGNITMNCISPLNQFTRPDMSHFHDNDIT